MEGTSERNDAANGVSALLHPLGGCKRGQCLLKQAEGDVIDREPKLLDLEKKKTC